LWAEDEYKNNPSSLPAKVYIEKVRVWADSLLAGFGPFSPEGTPPPQKLINIPFAIPLNIALSGERGCCVRI